MASLLERAQAFVLNGSDDEHAILRDAVADGGPSALAATQLLAEDMYGGITFNFELKAPAALALVAFGASGLEALVEMARRTPKSKNRTLCVSILAAVAAGRTPRLLGFLGGDEAIIEAARREASMADTALAARALLREYVLGIQDEVEAAAAIGHELSSMTLVSNDVAVVQELFAALAARRLAVQPAVLGRFEQLTIDARDDEPSWQQFLEESPQLLDPAVAEVWSRPDLSGVREPDFVVRRMDNSYMVVEIETPGKPIMTRANQLSAVATQAVGQATTYRSFLIERFPLAAKHFPNFSAPDCLVVIGIESELTVEQREALRRDNDSRMGLRVVGFDWLASRASTIAANVVRAEPAIKSLRVH
jgi:hypothetical protein